MYPYSNENRFDFPNTYMYTPFEGAKFLSAYFKNRTNAVIVLRKMTSTIMNSSGDVLVCQTHQELLEIQHNLQQKPYDESLLVGIEDYIRRFEVAKRLRNEYPIKNSLDLAPIHTHVLFYNILINAYEQFQDVRYLNVMLKVGDTLISALELLELHCDIEQLPILIKKEMQIVDTLIDKLDVHK